MLHKLLLKLLILIVILTRAVAAQSLPSCPDKCGNVTIPYPFGTKEGCYLSKSYYVNCTDQQISGTNITLLNISLDGLMRGSLPIGYRCYNKNHAKTSLSEPIIRLSRFPISSTRNLFTTVGCDARSNMKIIEGEEYITGCLTTSICNMSVNGPCLGMGCSQVLVPYNVTSFWIHAQSNTKVHVGEWKFDKCVYAFLVEIDRYSFHVTDFDMMLNRSFPVVFEWSVGNKSCKEAQKSGRDYVCSDNSLCIDAQTDFNKSYEGYRCQCAPGYRGNPYLPNGCQGSQNDCIYDCTNTIGSYNCQCFFGQHGDGRKNGSGCSYSGGSLFACISMVSAASVVLTLILYRGIKQRRLIKSRETFFKKNGGLILQKLIFEPKQSSQVAKIFPAGVLEKATNNFHKTNVIGQGGYSTVYKGILADKTVVAIKKYMSIDQNQIEQFINEVIVLSRISHPNVVKLVGCCLETQTPLLVYEFVTNKTVFQHLHEHDFVSSLTFERRLNIATQTAEALAYIHSTTQIVHRDVKSSNIILNDDFTAKVSDFGISRYIPSEETHIQTLIHGTLGYIDPEYFRSGTFTEKSDIYSFGMVLVELLTGKRVFSHGGTESDMGLATLFVSSLETGFLIQILDNKVKEDGLDAHIIKIANIAKDCVELEGKKRPNMKEVKEKLKELSLSYLKNSLIPKKVK
uniref:wall-associated receptor kinase 2-like n=1 Tax=Erigeron canadensis TaxID=72917 RepID=UPI001CB8F472|nr:wall-associated receptor kinase 2-like [Erigeron canadensis]